jgi:hypothetical protein
MRNDLHHIVITTSRAVGISPYGTLLYRALTIRKLLAGQEGMREWCVSSVCCGEPKELGLRN